MPSTIPLYPNNPKSCPGRRSNSGSRCSRGKADPSLWLRTSLTTDSKAKVSFPGAEATQDAWSWLTESSDCLSSKHTRHSRGANVQRLEVQTATLTGPVQSEGRPSRILPSGMLDQERGV